MGATEEDISGKLIISKFPNHPCFGKKKSSGLWNFFRASKICLLPALWACDLNKQIRRIVVPRPATNLTLKQCAKLTVDR